MPMCVTMRWTGACILVLAQVSASLGDEIAPIGTISANPSLYANRLVTFRGIVVRLERLPRILAKSCFSYDRYQAVIEDSTGLITAIVCGAPLDDTGAITQGDTVVRRAAILVPRREESTVDVVADAVLMERGREVSQ